MDNERWLARNIIRRENGEWRARVEPIPTPHMPPDKAREPFFETDY